jgi:glycosyltransferase involved in cell wall biosynthesis
MNQANLDSDNRIHILFFTSSLGNGGAEMHLLRVINHLNRHKFRLSLAIAQSGGAYEPALIKDVRIYPLNPPGIRSSTVRMIRAIAPLRQLIKTEQPDIVCSVLDHANLAAIAACRNLPKRPKLLIGVQNTPSAQYHRAWHPLDRTMRFLLKQCYPNVDRIIALSQGVSADVISLVPEIDHCTEIIYNAGVDESVIAGANIVPSETKPIDAPLIVACGRLTEQKGFPYLLEALAKVRQTIPAHLWILGEGRQRRELEQQIQILGLTDCVRLLGFQTNPYQYMAIADVFVLSSIYEGFGNVVVEAMACGAPIISTDCPYGPGEIIESGSSGLLVPPADINAIADAILQVLTHTELRQKLSANGKKRSHDFHASKIATAYEELFLRVALS